MKQVIEIIKAIMLFLALASFGLAFVMSISCINAEASGNMVPYSPYLIMLTIMLFAGAFICLVLALEAGEKIENQENKEKNNE